MIITLQDLAVLNRKALVATDWKAEEAFHEALAEWYRSGALQRLAELAPGGQNAAEERIYTKADMEAACELVRASNRLAEKISLDKMVDRFLAWKLPDSVCSDPCATQRGYPHRSGTTLLTADEAKQMLMHVLSLHPNIAPAATAPSNHRDAERYRWLRDRPSLIGWDWWVVKVPKDIWIDGEFLDAAIDSARAPSVKEGK